MEMICRDMGKELETVVAGLYKIVAPRRKEVASRVSMSYPHLCRTINGKLKDPTFSGLEEIAEAAGTSISELLGAKRTGRRMDDQVLPKLIEMIERKDEEIARLRKLVDDLQGELKALRNNMPTQPRASNKKVG